MKFTKGICSLPLSPSPRLQWDHLKHRSGPSTAFSFSPSQPTMEDSLPRNSKGGQAVQVCITLDKHSICKTRQLVAVCEIYALVSP